MDNPIRKTQNSSDFILNANLYKVLFTVSLPIMLNNLIQTLYNLTDTYFIGNFVNDVGVGAISFMWPLIYINLAVCVSFTGAGMVLIAQYLGARDTFRARITVYQLFFLAVAICVLIMPISYVFAPMIAESLGLSGDMYVYAMQYYYAILWEVPPMFLMSIYNAVKQGQGDTFTPMVFMGVSVALNIGLDYYFMHTLSMGMAGAAWATVLARVVVCIVMGVLLFSKRNTLRLSLREIRYDASVMKSLFKIAVPATVGETVTSLGFLILNYFILGFGEDVMSAFGVGNKINNIIMMPVLGLGSALAIIVAQHIGAQKFERAEQAVHKSMIIGIVIMLLGGVVTYVYSVNLVEIFVHGAGVVRESTIYLRFLAVTTFLMPIYQNFLGVFQGAGQTKHILYISLFRLWVVRIPMIIILGNLLNLGANGVWFSMSVSNLFVCILCWLVYRKKTWQKSLAA